MIQLSFSFLYNSLCMIQEVEIGLPILLRTPFYRKIILYPRSLSIFELLCREIKEYLLYRGFFRPQNITSVARIILQAKLVKGTLCKGIFLNIPKKLLYKILSSFGLQLNDGKNPEFFKRKILKNLQDQWVVIQHTFPIGQKVKLPPADVIKQQ